MSQKTFSKVKIEVTEKIKSIKNSTRPYLSPAQSLLARSLLGFISRDLRAKSLMGFWGIIILLLLGRLFFLQVVRGAHYSRISEENRIQPWTLPAPRGKIMDRNGKIIAQNRPSYSVSLIPYEASEVLSERKSLQRKRDLAPLVERLASCLKTEESSLKKKIESNWSKGYQPIRLKKDVDFNTICMIEEQNEDLPGVIYQVEPTRKYLTPGWVGHVVGYVNELTREELFSKSSERSFRLGGVIGRKGLEKQYDDLLRGKDGVTFLEVTAQGKILGALEERKPDLPQSGSDLKLTIDLDLQAVAESALTNYKSAAVVALDPRNGEILALVSKPGLDANLFVGAMSFEEWNSILENPLHPLLTRPIQATYPPGSILKLLTAAIALETKMINKNTYLSPCGGSFRFGRKTFRCWRPEGHGRLNLMEAIIQSCDIYFYQLGLKMGLERWTRYARLCGLGLRTGVDLPDEAKGFVPDLDYYQKKHGKANWVKNLVINLAIGQGEILVTPLQMAVFLGGLSTDGTLYKPFLVKEIIDPDGKVVLTQPQRLGSLPFSPSTLKVLQQAMIGVVNDPHGTGVLAQIPGITVGGKTGTAQNPHGQDHAWFVGYGPASDPQMVVAVLIENAGHGGTYAAPVAKRIMEKYLRKGEAQITGDQSLIGTH